MKNRSDVGQIEFNALLDFFSPDREEAGIRYEQIRGRLIRYFEFKGCSDAPQLADTTLNRVAAKLHTYDHEKGSTIESFIHGFAWNIVKEAWRGNGREQPLNGNEIHTDASGSEPLDLLSLRSCLEKLHPDERRLILMYHRVPEGREKAAVRQKLCDELNLTSAAVYTKVSRIKAKLRVCIEEHKKVSL